jgi:hypothetical protein
MSVWNKLNLLCRGPLYLEIATKPGHYFLIKPDVTVMVISLCNITKFTKHFSFFTDYLSLYFVGTHLTESKK